MIKPHLHFTSECVCVCYARLIFLLPRDTNECFHCISMLPPAGTCPHYDPDLQPRDNSPFKDMFVPRRRTHFKSTHFHSKQDFKILMHFLKSEDLRLVSKRSGSHWLTLIFLPFSSDVVLHFSQLSLHLKTQSFTLSVENESILLEKKFPFSY